MTRAEAVRPRKYTHEAIQRIRGFSDTVRDSVPADPDAFDRVLAAIEAEVASAERAA
jgi:hypothetical protein